MSASAIFGSFLGFGAPGFATSPGGEGALASFDIPKYMQRATEQPLWSTQNLGATGTVLANANQFRLFSTQLSGNGQGFAPMTISETNLREAGRVSSGAAYAIYGIAGQVYNFVPQGTATGALQPTATDLWNLTNNCVLLWSFMNTTTLEIAPLSLIGAGGGVFGSTADTGGAYGAAGIGSQVSLNNGAGAVWIYQFLPVMLPGNQQFNVLAQFGGSASPIDLNGAADLRLALRVVLLGTYRNAVPVG